MDTNSTNVNSDDNPERLVGVVHAGLDRELLTSVTNHFADAGLMANEIIMEDTRNLDAVLRMASAWNDVYSGLIFADTLGPYSALELFLAIKKQNTSKCVTALLMTKQLDPLVKMAYKNAGIKHLLYCNEIQAFDCSLFLPKSDNLFDKFDLDASNVMAAADKFAREQQAPLTADHLFKALITVPQYNTTVANVLQASNILSQSDLLTRLEANSYLQSPDLAAGSIVPDCGHVLRSAENEAALAASTTISSGHLLIGLLQSHSSVAGDILREAGLDTEPLRKMLVTH